MDPEFEGMSESELRDLLEKADGYDERSKIRSALRSLKKASGKDRKPTGTSVYRRPGFQAPKNVQIPNSVTGNVLPQTLKDGDSVKPPDKNTPTIGYLNAGTTRTPKKAGRTSSTQSTGTQGGGGGTGMKEQETWWRQSQSSSRSSRSQTPSDIPEQKSHDETSLNDNPDQVFADSTHKEPTPEPPREETPEPPREPTPEPPREPTPEPPREPTPESPREPTPESPREPTPEPPREPTPEPPREPTPEPERAQTPSPDPVIESVPSPEPDTPVESGYMEEQAQEYEGEENEGEEDEQFSDDEDEELQALADHQTSQQGSNLELAVNKSLPIDVLQEVEPGLEENKDFRTKLRKAEDTKIDTKAAFPSQKKSADQVDFRNVLRKTTGPEKKSFQVEQVDFRNKLKPKDVDTPTHTPSRTPDEERDPSEDKLKVQQYEEEEQELDEEQEVQEEEEEEKPEEVVDEESINKQVTPEIITPEVVTPEVKGVSSPDVKKDGFAEDSYEARKEARRREREEREKQLKDVQDKVDNSLENGVLDEDSYEARREARRKAREARRLKESQEVNKKPAMSYREQQRLDQAKRMEENKKKWGEMDQSNAGGNIEKPAISRQRSTGAQKGAQQLLAWCQHKTKYYENVEVKDFSNSFANGLALCAILHTFVPDAIPYDDLSPDNPAENFGVALQVSEDIGIGSFFDVEDLLQVKSPDPKSMMTYLATIYQHFK